MAAYNKQITQGSRGEKSPEASLSVCPADTAPAEASGNGGKRNMKQHRFWAWAMVFCLAMTLITGYRHK